MEGSISSNDQPVASSSCIQTVVNTSGEPIDDDEILGISTETEPVKTNGKHVADYISPHGEKMSFYFFNHTTPIWVQLHHDKSTEKLVPLWISKLNENENHDHVLRTVRRSLQSIYVRPEYFRMEKLVRFSSTHSKDRRNKDRILQSYFLPLPIFNSVFVYQSNGCISYVNCKNEIINWNKGSRRKKDLINTSNNITALAEQNGDLIVGYENGNIFIPRLNKSIRSKTSSVVEIAVIGFSHFAVRYQDDSANLFSIEEGAISSIIYCEQVSGIWSVQDRFFVALQDRRVLRFVDIYEYEIFYEKTFSSELHHDNFIVVPDTVCVVANDEISIWKGNTSWDILNKEKFFSIWQNHGGKICEKNCDKCHRSELDRKITCAEESWQDFMKSITEKTCVFISPGTFIFPQIPHSWVICITYFSMYESRPFMIHGDGILGVTSMLLLSDGSLMYATKESPSGIYVITDEGECIFSNQEKLLHKKERVSSLKELDDGSVAVECFDSNKKFIKIISTRGQSQKIINRVNELRSELANNPKKLDLYDELVKLYLPIDQSDFSDHHSAYRTYLDGLEAAARAGNFYYARRFYEKSRNIFPDREEPMRLFLSFLLTKFPNNGIEKRIQLDLFELIENKKCKSRLFIGEGDFSYTESLIKKHIRSHKQLSQSIVATELLEPHQIIDPEVIQRIERLKEYKVTVLTGIDGQKIHENPELKKHEKFKRIHWNCPFNPADRDSFRQVIPNFFRSCERIQKIGDRIHVTLMQGWNDDEWHERRQYENPIVKGSKESAYHLIRKRRFGGERYPGYQHKSTKGDKLDLPGELREFVFEKISPTVYEAEVTEEKIRNSLPIKNTQKKYFIKVNYKKFTGVDEIKPEGCYFDCSTDDDSSDYYSD